MTGSNKEITVSNIDTQSNESNSQSIITDDIIACNFNSSLSNSCHDESHTIGDFLKKLKLDHLIDKFIREEIHDLTTLVILISIYIIHKIMN